jgi:uncharacterized protein (TIGR02271 family)
MEQPEPVPVIAQDGARGVIVSPQPDQTGASQVLVRFDSGEQMLIPSDSLVMQADGRYYYLPYKLADLAALPTEQDELGNERIVVPVIAEQLDVQRRRYETGRVRISKRVHEREEVVDEPLLQEQVDVQRVEVNRVIDQPVSVRYEGDTMIIPVLEEVLVVEKRLMLKEELRITRRQVTSSQPQAVLLRSEEVIVERVQPVETEESVETGGKQSAN